MRVRELMTEGVSCRQTANLAAVAALMWEKNCGAISLVDRAGKVIGVITDRDICIALGTRNRPASEIAAVDVTAGPAIVCGADDEVDKALETMRNARVGRLPVVNNRGKLVGAVSINDLNACPIASGAKDSAEKALAQEPLKIAAPVNNTHQIDPIMERHIEEEYAFKAFADGKSPHSV